MNSAEETPKKNRRTFKKKSNDPVPIDPIDCQKIETETPPNEDSIFLTLSILMDLLREDSKLRSQIRSIVATHDVEDEAEFGSPNKCDMPLESTHEASRNLSQSPSPLPILDTLRMQIAPELALLYALREDPELAVDWLGNEAESEGRQLLRLVVCCAQWDLLSDLWEKLSNRCKSEKRYASSNEMLVLKSALGLHNLRWRGGRQAELAEVNPGTVFDYERHQRGTITGDVVVGLWLPGLVNAGGQLQKKPLVQT